MNRPALTVAKLKRSEFKSSGCWELSDEQALTHKIDLPAKSGVYAFAIDGIVQYVGVSAKSLRQRFAFYVKPGVSQTTSIRLNEVICGRIGEGATVEILIAHPPDQRWNGLTVSGPEGLEAGLIRDFALPWNKRGKPKVVQASAKEGHTKKAERVLDVIRRRRGMTELEIARAIYGSSAVQQQVNAECRRLVKLGLVERLGRGGQSDPFTYRPTKKANPGSSRG